MEKLHPIAQGESSPLLERVVAEQIVLVNPLYLDVSKMSLMEVVAATVNELVAVLLEAPVSIAD